MPPKRILLSEWPLFVEKSFQQKNLRLIAVREQPKVSEKFQSEVHKYVLHLQNDRDIIKIVWKVRETDKIDKDGC